MSKSPDPDCRQCDGCGFIGLNTDIPCPCVSTRPPLGLMPRRYWDETRLDALRSAVVRYVDAGLPIPPQWILEADELSARLSQEAYTV